MIKKRISRRKLLQTASLALTSTFLALEACADTPQTLPTATIPTGTATLPLGAAVTYTTPPATTSASTTTVEPTTASSGATTPTAPVPAPTTIPTQVPPPEFAVQPYISRVQQLAPLFDEPNQSFYLQPWRGFLETMRADRFLAGIGINYNLPDTANDRVILQLLADSGFKAIRLEISWTLVPWEEDRFTNQGRLNTILTTCKALDITPLILLNANEGAPGPNLSYKRTLKAAATKGSRTLQLDSVADLVAGRSGLTTEGFMTGLLFTALDQATSTVQLSRPLPDNLVAGTEVQINTLKYLPLYPVGTPQFEETATGWLNYVRLVTELLRHNNIVSYELEIWNEISFGSSYLSINNYYDPPLLPEVSEANSLLAGGAAWELARRTAEQVKMTESGARIIWGFSNTTFYHTAIPKLPAGIDGQSYHPYGTDRKIIPRDFPPKERYDWFIEKYIPKNLAWCMPEGWAHLGVQTETLMRLLNPETRHSNLPPGATTFAHYMTEHGFLPQEAGITDKVAAQNYKAKALIRAVLFWLNKGISKMYIYSAYQPLELEQGMLLEQADMTNFPAELPNPLISPALQALKHLVEVFGSRQQSKEFEARQLAVEVTALGDQPAVFEGDATHPPLYYRDMTAIIPFQTSPNRFLVAFYTMSYDFSQPFPGLDVRVTLKNLPAGQPRVLLFDPIINQYVLSQKIEFLEDGVAITATTKDYPLIIILDYT